MSKTQPLPARDPKPGNTILNAWISVMNEGNMGMWMGIRGHTVDPYCPV